MLQYLVKGLNLLKPIAETDCQPHHSSYLLPSRPTKVRNERCKTSQLLSLNAAVMHNEILFPPAVENLLVGRLWGQSVVSCNLPIWSLLEPQMEGEVYTAHTRRPRSFNTTKCGTGNLLYATVTSRYKESSVGKLDSTEQ